MSGNYWSWLLKRFPKKGKFQPVKHLPDGKLMQSCSELSMAKYSMKVFSESVSLLSDCSLICLLTHSSTSRHSEPWFINDISSFDWFSTSILAQYSVSRLLLFTISANWTNGRKCVKILGKKKTRAYILGDKGVDLLDKVLVPGDSWQRPHFNAVIHGDMLNQVIAANLDHSVHLQAICR